jgi:hypothetical protein
VLQTTPGRTLMGFERRMGSMFRGAQVLSPAAETVQ